MRHASTPRLPLFVGTASLTPNRIQGHGTSSPAVRALASLRRPASSQCGDPARGRIPPRYGSPESNPAPAHGPRSRHPPRAQVSGPRDRQGFGGGPKRYRCRGDSETRPSQRSTSSSGSRSSISGSSSSRGPHVAKRSRREGGASVRRSAGFPPCGESLRCRGARGLAVCARPDCSRSGTGARSEKLSRAVASRQCRTPVCPEPDPRATARSYHQARRQRQTG